MTKENIQSICVLYILCWLIAPPLAYGSLYRLLAVVAAALWICIASSSNKKEYEQAEYRRKNTYLVFGAVVLLSRSALRFYLSGGSISVTVSTEIGYYIMFFVGYIACWYVMNKEYDKLRPFFQWVIILSVIFSLTSIFRDSEYYDAVRYAGESTEANGMAVQAAKKGIGAFGFFNLTAAIAPITLFISYYCDNKKEKRLYRIAFVIIEIGVITGGFTIALITSLIGILIVMFMKMRSPYTKILLAGLVLLSVLFWSDFSAWLYSVLSKLTYGTFYENKVEDVFGFLIQGQSSGSFRLRIDRYILTAQALIMYPVIGSAVLAGRISGGYHSSIFDTISTYGWIVGYMWAYIVVFPCGFIHSKNKDSAVLKIMSATILLLLTVFNQYAMNLCVLFLFIPAAHQYVEDYDLKKKNEQNNRKSIYSIRV